MKSYSQYAQDKFVVEYFGENYKGTFIDIGAHNGITYSNSKLLEELGWVGICVEPLPHIYKELIKNRTCTCLNCAFSNKTEIVEFMSITKPNTEKDFPEMLSGIFNLYDERHKQRVEREIKNYKCTSELIKVQAYNFNDIVEELNIDYMSIDTEGCEYEILDGIDYNKYNIKLIGIEENFEDTREKFNKLMESKGYHFLKKVGIDIFYEKN